MAQEHIRRMGQFPAYFRHQAVFILHRPIPPAGKNSGYIARTHRFSMAHVVVAHHGNAVLCEKPSEFVVAFHMLCHTVDQLDHRSGRLPGHPQAAPQIASTGGGHKKFAHVHAPCWIE